MDKFKKYFLSFFVFLINIGLVFLGYQAIKKNSETKKAAEENAFPVENPIVQDNLEPITPGVNDLSVENAPITNSENINPQNTTVQNSTSQTVTLPTNSAQTNISVPVPAPAPVSAPVKKPATKTRTS